MSAAKGTSATRATARGLPLSTDSNSANSSACSRIRSPIFQINLPRSLGVIRRHGPDSKARRAALTARFISSLSLSGTRAITDASAGLKTSKVLPDAAETHFPAMRFCFGLASHAPTPELIAGLDDGEEAWPLPVGVRPAVRLLLGRRTLVRRWEAVVFIGIKTL